MSTQVFSNALFSLAPAMPSFLQARLKGLARLDEIEELYQRIRVENDEIPIATRLLAKLDVRCRVSERDLEHIPRTGPVMVTVNHPFGILEGALLATILKQIRPDIRFLANSLLNVIPEAHDLLIPVNPMGGRSGIRESIAGLKGSVEHLLHAGLLVVFPAGEVSHFQWSTRSVSDSAWSPALARILKLARKRGSKVQVVPSFVPGMNSLAFHLAGMLHPRLRSAFIGRELLNKKGQEIEIRIGTPIAGEKLENFSSDDEATAYLRWRTYLLASRSRFKPMTSLPMSNPSTPAVLECVRTSEDGDVMAGEIARLSPEQLLAEANDLQTFIAGADQIPNTLQEIGRLREVTFRAAGEGTGKALDLDRFDGHYLHLFLWNAKKREIAGAYRLAKVDDIRERMGIDGLYTATLFHYGDSFLDVLGPALELGRSFVRAEYQRSFAPLLLLWKAIGRYVSQSPRYKTLFGPVSISNSYPSVSRDLITSFLERFAPFPGRLRLVKAKRCNTQFDRPPAGFNLGALDLDEVSNAVADLDPQRRGVPVLLRHYLNLGGKLLGFSLDPSFSNTLDGLIVVDLTQTNAKLLSRYLGRKEAAQFLEFQKGSYGT